MSNEDIRKKKDYISKHKDIRTLKPPSPFPLPRLCRNLKKRSLKRKRVYLSTLVHTLCSLEKLDFVEQACSDLHQRYQLQHKVLQYHHVCDNVK